MKPTTGRWMIVGLSGVMLTSMVTGPLLAMGKRGRYVSTAEDEIHPAQRGSAANPNSAFAPPRFDEYVPPARSADAKAPRPKAASHSSAPADTSDAWSAPVQSQPSKSVPSSSLETPSAPPTPAKADTITPADSSEPPALDISPEPSGVSGDAHPPAR